MKAIQPPTFPVVAIEGERDALLAPYRHAVSAMPGAIVMPGDESALASPAVRGLQQGLVDAWDAAFATVALRWAQTGCNTVLDPFYAALLPERALAATLELASGKALEGDKDRARVAAPLAAFAEWEWFKLRGDKSRLAHAYEILLADHRYRQSHEKRRNGLFAGTPGPYRLNATGRFMLGGRIVPSLALGSSWVDACGMQAMAGRMLADMARVLGHRDQASLLDWDLRDLAARMNLVMWNEDDGWYYDLDEHGAPLPMRTLAGIFAVLGGVAPRNRADAMLAKLGDPTRFERAHPLSTVAASEGDYRKRDGTPVGVVRSEFNVAAWECYFAVGRASKGQQQCESHLRRVAKVLADSGELYLAYDPDRDMPAPIPDGNSGAEAPLAWAAAIQETLSVLLGIRPHGHRGELELCLHLDEKHRVEGLPFQTGIVNFEVSATPMSGGRRSVEMQCDIPIKLRLRRGESSLLHELNPGFHTLQA
ncbi:MAG: hypothetical protein IPP14_13375 [Planctomycetes bacterium]|nr:hypothetical protein [Planctomycetota bacterium]